jgi:rSAM/selenodomain-associated transferase 1
MKLRQALIILAKAPLPNIVKTRLKGHLSDEVRLRFYRDMLEAVVERLGSIPNVDTWLSFTPAGEEAYFRKFGLRLFPQSEGDIGLRMHHALTHLLSQGYGKAVLVGVDIPGLDSGIVLHAMDLLKDHDMVFGPAVDGGYYLVGLKKPASRVFESIEWSTQKTLEQSTARAREQGFTISLTETLSDVDTIDDVKEFLESKNQS